MAPSATSVQSLPSKVKRPIPPGIQTNGIHSSTSSPSPSMSAGRLPNSGKPPNSATSNGPGTGSGVRSASRARRDTPGLLLGRGQRNSSVGLRSASIVGESAASQAAEPTPYVKTDEYILKRYRNSKPSLIVHLHTTHFRFDQQEGSFSYKSPMKILIEHLKQRTIPHDLVEFFTEVPFYEGCMIIQVHDHKSTVQSQSPSRVDSTVGKPVPFSVHNYNAYLTPSPYVPFPTRSNSPGKTKVSSDGSTNDSDKIKTAEQKDKENMPAPAAPGDGQRGKPAVEPKKPKVFTIVLRPTPLSDHNDLAVKVAEALSNTDGRRDSRQEPLSATVPPTPTTAIPSTPQASMAPPAKRLKKNKVDLDSHSIYAAVSQIALATTAPLVLDPVSSAADSAALLESLTHPMHAEKPPSPKIRKRTVAEMAADEALAAEQERYMLILDERLAASGVGAQGAGNPADGDGQAGGASFEPRFERFKTLENIKAQHEENRRIEKLKQLEAERKQSLDRERERLRQESEKKEQQQENKLRANLAAQQHQQQAAARQQQEAHRRQLAAQAQNQPSQQGIQGQHGHPQPNNIIPSGIHGQPQRFHQQQGSQAQISSPIVRNGTPQSHSSPTVSAMGNPMQHSTSSMGGSPARPGSVVHQNHPQMGAPGSNSMTAQRSQQSHAGTPRMPNATPNMQNTTPLNRQMSQTPRMSQGSPSQRSMAHAQHMPVMGNGIQMNPAQQHHLPQQRVQELMRNQQNATAQNLARMANNQQLTPQQMMLLRQQHPGMSGGQPTQNYANQMAAIAARPNLPQGMNQNFMGNSPGMPNMQQVQMQQLQQMQMRQAQQAQVQAHAQAQAQAQARQHQAQQGGQNSIVQQQIRQQATRLYRERLPGLQNQHPGGIPPEVEQAFKVSCQAEASRQVAAHVGAMRQQQQQQLANQQLMAAQAGMQQNMGGMPNGMGM